ncbi:MAG: HNH endonuclease, partial [Acidimicrobiia bacterium]|nr:HNH endonuclease [Acidimicrobiia bacterium]
RDPAGSDDDEFPKIVPPKRDLLFMIDLAAYRRGKALSGETCELAGIGPVPVEVAAELDTDPFIKAVIRDGTDIKTVVHYGRHVPAELRTALEARGVQCAVPGCSNCTYLEVDHATLDYAAGGPLAIWNTQWLCPYHHRRKTQGLLDLDLPPPAADLIE